MRYEDVEQSASLCRCTQYQIDVFRGKQNRIELTDNTGHPGQGFAIDERFLFLLLRIEGNSKLYRHVLANDGAFDDKALCTPPHDIAILSASRRFCDRQKKNGLEKIRFSAAILTADRYTLDG